MKKLLLSIPLIIALAANAAILFNINFFFVREILSCLFLLIIPGFLTLLSLKIKNENVWEFIIYTVGTSLALLLGIGLAINLLLPSFGIHNPLTSTPFLVAIDSFVLPVWIHLFLKRKHLQLPIHIGRMQSIGLSLPIGVISLLFPLLSGLGALNINNGQSNILTMTMLGSIGAYVLLLTFLRKKLDSFVFPLAIFMMSVSFLLMTSLRGWYITGHDIYLEYYVFQLTKLHNFWSMTYFQDPYMACLSITLLPTLLANVTTIPDAYIFKLIYQVIFSFSMVGVYLFLKKYTQPFIAFLAAFATISFPTFMTDMPMLNRQEIAFFFFVLLLHSLFNKNFSLKIRWILSIIFGFGLIMSHYATTYLSVSLFIVAALIHVVITLLKKNPLIKKKTLMLEEKAGISESKPWFNLGIALLLLLGTIVWYGTFTKTSVGLQKAFNNIVQAINGSTAHQSKSDGPANNLLNSKQPDKQALLNSYVDKQTAYVRKFNDESAFLSKDISSKFRISSIPEETMPVTPVGEILNSKLNVFALNDSLKQIYAKTAQALIGIGLLSIFLYKKYMKKMDEEYVLLSFTFILLILFQLIFSSAAIDYGLLRLIQQGLFLLSLPLVIGLLSILAICNKFIKNINVYLSSIVLVFFFLYLSGFTSQIIGGYYPQLNLNNGGFYYDAYFLHTSELQSLEWIKKNRDLKSKLPIQADWFAGKKIHTFADIYSIDGIVPSEIRKNSYVYLDYSNVVNNQVIVYAGGIPIYYKTPSQLLNENKNLIYNNGRSKIYK